MSRIITLDVETTGLSVTNSHRIIELACVEVGKEYSSYFHRYINPERDVDYGAYKVHGISDGFLKDKPKFRDIAAEFLAFISGAEIVIHNAPFDLSFVNHELKLSRMNVKSLESICKIIDSLKIARAMFPRCPNKLDDLASRFNINTSRDKHGALLDARILSEVYTGLINKSSGNEGINTTSNQSEFTIITCPECSQLLRVPKGKRLRVTCSNCKRVFERMT